MAKACLLGKGELPEIRSVAILADDFGRDFFRAGRAPRHNIAFAKPLREVAVAAAA